MKSSNNPHFKHVIRCQLLSTRSDLDITQSEIAERLHISTRAYTRLESGHTCLSTETLIRFLYNCCRDKDSFLDDLYASLADFETTTIS